MRPKEVRGGRGAFVPGDVIVGRYVVERMLGEGGMGIVYQCLDRVGGVSVAVKCLPPEVSRNADEMEDIRTNYRLVADLHHPNIAGARTLELDESTGDYYLVMDLARGTSLKRWMRRNPQATMEAKLAILRQVAAALDYAHARKVIHRDVKPENVMVDDEDGVKVLDFGLAAQIRSSQSRTSNAVTSKGGTPGYKSPEQWRGKPQREAADVYSFGVMAYWLFAGVLPFDGDDLAVLGHAVLTAPVEPIAGFPARMNAALVKALAKQPEERFASCGEFMDALEGKDSFSRKERKEAGGPRLVAAVKGLLAAAALGLAAFGGWWWMSGREGTKGTQGTEETIGTNVVQVSSVTQVASPAPKPIPPEAGLTDADVAEIAVEASEQKSRIERIDDADGFHAQKLALDDVLNCATTNRKEKLWAEAAQDFTNYVNGCKELLKLDQERQTAKKSKADAEAAKARASEVEAQKYVKPRWDATSALLEEANDAFGKMSFAAAAAKYAAAAKQFDHCVDEAKTERKRQEDDAAAKAKAEQEKRKRLEEARERAMLIEKEIVRYIEPELKRFKAEDCAQPTLADGNKLRKQGDGALSRGDFTEAEGKLKQAKDKLEAAVKEAKDYRVDAPLRRAREHSAALCWQQCIDECDKALGWDSDNADAKRLKAEAEGHLGPRHGECRTMTLPGGVKMEMIYVAPGSFTMGSPETEDGRSDKETQHRVTLTKGYWLGKYEVTQRQWESVMGENPSQFNGANRPVEKVSWEDCQRFIAKVDATARQQFGGGARLPTEAEWEYACRAGTTGRYGGNGNLDDVGWHCENSGSETHPVGRKKPNNWGFYDIHGNVLEWCQDWYGDYQVNANNPQGPVSGVNRVLRGGSWNLDVRSCRSATRDGDFPGSRCSSNGFRLCCSAEPRGGAEQ